MSTDDFAPVVREPDPIEQAEEEERRRGAVGLGRMGRPPRSLEERFWSFVQKGDGCWLWIGPKNRQGYGRIGSGGTHSKYLAAHRVSWEMAHQTKVPEGQIVRHTCDTPACVRPDHLLTGTYKDNAADCVERGRKPRGATHFSKQRPELTLKGVQQGRAKLDDDKVREIRRRAADGESINSLAVAYGVSWPTAEGVVRRRLWKHVA